MNGAWTSEPEERRRIPRINGLALMVAGVLVVGGGVGLALNRTTVPTETALAAIPGDPATDPLTPVSTGAEAMPAPTLVRTSAAAPRLLDVKPPENPFLRTAADPVALAPVADNTTASAEPATKMIAAPQGVAHPGAPAVTLKRAAAPAEAEAAPDADDLALTGIVQGDPPVAVVKYSGQSLFLKIGDQVADTWRLVEFKERSAIFQLGAQRVEIPIKGGSSE